MLGRPFRWDEGRWLLIRCELDAASFHLNLGSEEEWIKDGTRELLPYFPRRRDAMDYILETLAIVKRQDEQKFGEYRTKRVILEVYDEMVDAIRTGSPYRTRLDPPPGTLGRRTGRREAEDKR